MNELLLWAALALAVLNAGLLIWIVLQRGGAQDQAELDRRSRETAHQALLALVANSSERLERELRREISESARGGRQELTQNLATFQQTLVQQGAQATRTQNNQIDAFAQ